MCTATIFFQTHNKISSNALVGVAIAFQIAVLAIYFFEFQQIGAGNNC